jgi:hypothetical protein
LTARNYVHADRVWDSESCMDVHTNSDSRMLSIVFARSIRTSFLLYGWQIVNSESSFLSTYNSRSVCPFVKNSRGLAFLFGLIGQSLYAKVVINFFRKKVSTVCSTSSSYESKGKNLMGSFSCRYHRWPLSLQPQFQVTSILSLLSSPSAFTDLVSQLQISWP